MGREVAMNVSSEIAWGIIRDNSSFLLKKRGVKKPFSTEACNLTNRNAMRYNGLVNTKAVGVSAAADNKGFVVTTKRAKLSHKPSKAAMRRAAAIVRSQKPLPKRKGPRLRRPRRNK